MRQSEVCATDFNSSVVYRSSREPGYAAWVSFFPGTDNTWYIGCEEVSKVDPPRAGATPEQRYAFVLPKGYDKSHHQMEMVLLESSDDLSTWQVVSRTAARFQHSAGQFGQAAVGANRFVRFVWQSYSLESDNPGAILRISDDRGKTWRTKTVHDPRFASYPHRLRTLSDGTLVLALPFAPRFSVERPRGASLLNADSETRMTFVTSTDGGETWSQPVPVYGGRPVSETDFVELPSGDLLFVNGTIFQDPGRQIVYRTAYGWIPGPYERCANCEGYTVNPAPETVAMTEDGVIVGALRNGRYSWSDDYGIHWYPLSGIPDHIMNPPAHGAVTEIYQPWINYLGNGEFACAGHYGFDDPLEKGHANYINLHRFRLVVGERLMPATLSLRRCFDTAVRSDRNRYVVHFESNGSPVVDREIELWYFVYGKDEGADPFNRLSLEERITKGGQVMRGRTDRDGICVFNVAQFDDVPEEDIHHYVQYVVRFVPEDGESEVLATTSLVYGFYTNPM